MKPRRGNYVKICDEVLASGGIYLFYKKVGGKREFIPLDCRGIENDFTMTMDQIKSTFDRKGMVIMIKPRRNPKY